MGFFEDDRIRHKNREITPPVPPTYLELKIQLDKDINIGELLAPLFANFDVTLLDDRKTIALKHK
jgi:hypothetical protein